MYILREKNIYIDFTCIHHDDIPVNIPHQIFTLCSFYSLRFFISIYLTEWVLFRYFGVGVFLFNNSVLSPLNRLSNWKNRSLGFIFKKNVLLIKMFLQYWGWFPFLNNKSRKFTAVCFEWWGHQCIIILSILGTRVSNLRYILSVNNLFNFRYVKKCCWISKDNIKIQSSIIFILLM